MYKEGAFYALKIFEEPANAMEVKFTERVAMFNTLVDRLDMLSTEEAIANTSERDNTSDATREAETNTVVDLLGLGIVYILRACCSCYIYRNSEHDTSRIWGWLVDNAEIMAHSIGIIKENERVFGSQELESLSTIQYILNEFVKETIATNGTKHPLLKKALLVTIASTIAAPIIVVAAPIEIPAAAVAGVTALGSTLFFSAVKLVKKLRSKKNKDSDKLTQKFNEKLDAAEKKLQANLNEELQAPEANDDDVVASSSTASTMRP